MGIYYAYILKSAICLVCFYSLYRSLLSRETFHRFNRITLMSVLFLSFIIPLLQITVTQQTEISQTVATVEQLLIATDMPVQTTETVVRPIKESFSWMQMVAVIYLVGIFFLVCRNLYSFCRMYLLLKSGGREKLDGYVTLIVHERDIAPFSWMKYIVISHKDLEENGQEILIHEYAHIRNGHSWDLLAADICIYLQWFNPAAWLLKQEFQDIHEYEADETVLKKGIDAKQYQLLLIKKAVGTRLYSMTNSLNHSKLKKRIAMMLKEKSNPWARLKYLYALPLVALAIVAFSCNGNNKPTPVASVSVEEPKVEEPVIDSVGINPKPFIAKQLEEKKPPLVIMDGKEVDASVFLELPDERIRSARGTKPAEALKMYGEKAKNGVWQISTFSANKIKVNGVVQDEQDKPIVGGLVFMEGSNAAIITDEKGKFVREAPEDAMLKVSADGYISQKIKPSPNPIIRLKKK